MNPLLSTGGTNTAGAHQLFPEDVYEEVDLVTLLDPENKRAYLPGAEALNIVPALVSVSSEPVALKNTELERAFRAFYQYGSNPEDRRNRLQDRILGASEQRCTTYKLYLRRVETGQSTTTGILATVLGGVGAIATNVNSARALAGLAGISSGIGAELKQGYFANVASNVIVPGIDLARIELRREMLNRRIGRIGDYNVEAALVDASRYHAACSINAGLERAGEAVREVNNPGIRQLNLTLAQLGVSQKLARRLNDDTVVVTQADLQLANGGFPAAVVATNGYPSGALAQSAESITYIGRLFKDLHDRSIMLVSLKEEARLAALALENLLLSSGLTAGDIAPPAACAAPAGMMKAKCQFRLKLQVMLANVGSAETPTVFKGLQDGFDKLPPAAYRTILSAADADIGAQVYRAAIATPGSPEDIKAQHDFKQIAYVKAALYVPAETQFALMDQAFRNLRIAIKANAPADVDSAMAAVKDSVAAIGALK